MSLRTLGMENGKSLIIFNSFRVDESLPKRIAMRQEYDTKMKMNRNVRFVSGSAEEDFGDDETDFVANPGSIVFPNRRINKMREGSWWQRLLQWFGFAKPEVESVITVFARIKASAEELAGWSEKDKSLTDMIQRAKTAGQKEMVAKLEKELVVRRYENLLYVKGYRKLLTEEQMLAFTAKCEKGLCLDWVGNFIRPIPDDVVAEKAKCDEAHIFDNYVVLHYDPENRATTPEARQKARDPILFGVIEGSRKLYFVGDWVDEQCDLTFAEIVKTLGSPLEMTEETPS